MTKRAPLTIVIDCEQERPPKRARSIRWEIESRCVYLAKEPQGFSARQVVDFLNLTMKVEGLSDKPAIIRFCTSKQSGKLIFEVQTAELAEKLCYLNGIYMGKNVINLSRGIFPPTTKPLFSCWNEFCLHRNGRKNTSPSIQKQPIQTGNCVSQYKDGRLGSSNCVSQYKDGRLGSSPSNDKVTPIIERSTTNKESEQEHALDKQRLAREMAKLVRVNASLKKKLELVLKENDQLREREVERQIFSTNEQQQQQTPSQFIPKEEVTKIEDRLENKTLELKTTERQLMEVHKSWQEQAMELMDKQKRIDELTQQLKQSETKFRTTKDSLERQTTALTTERKAKRKLEAAVWTHTQSHKKLCRALTSYQKTEI